MRLLVAAALILAPVVSAQEVVSVDEATCAMYQVYVDGMQDDFAGFRGELRELPGGVPAGARVFDAREALTSRHDCMILDAGTARQPVTAVCMFSTVATASTVMQLFLSIEEAVIESCFPAFNRIEGDPETVLGGLAGDTSAFRRLSDDGWVERVNIGVSEIPGTDQMVGWIRFVRTPAATSEE